MRSALFTIGYGNRSLQEVLTRLREESVQFLIDVRTSPRSKFNPDFEAEALDCALHAAGIRYVFMGDTLGGRPEDLSCYENGHVIYERVQNRPFFQRGIERLLSALDQQFRVCLLCSELNPADCHRSKLIGVALSALSVDVIHFSKSGERLTQADVMASLASLQGDLFGAGLRSRKSYGGKALAAGRSAGFRNNGRS
jgi:uncharacterized protein (DUF488 family)